MSDIVERLRKTAAFIAQATGKENSRWVHEAADEIERLRGVAQQPSRAIPTRNEQIVHGAVDRGNAQYWVDCRRQEAAFKEWEAAGYEGDCRQCLNGSVVDYITRAIMSLSEPSKKMLEGASTVSSTHPSPPRLGASHNSGERLPIDKAESGGETLSGTERGTP